MNNPTETARREMEILRAAIEAALIPCGLACGPAVIALDRLVALATVAIPSK